MEDIAYIKTPLGVAKIVGDAEGVSAITVLNSDEPLTDVIPESLEDAVYQLNEYFEGARTEFNLTLNPVGTEFQKKVWVELQNIPYGKSKSYLELAKALGDPNATRAAASANARNPLWIVVPCHRVIGTDGSLTGYAGGLHRKQWLLNHESPVKQQSLF
ncbi:MAG TPA: cysteine methyltransferase [Maribacter sp.]|uniref:methylated-DNA--[protein]-cysteine S-methyltransferase n=1 Tax=Maribacter TaxID=252356 RepID=UPI000EE36FE7|nr:MULTISPECIES: methylated-DNA--[protein]-cysteine S-methyltransferase [Maribacter]MDP2526591.1 methylated-DNA--[protein]-cysteine S-methyltransferase [Maribacter dokdonensis]HAF76917.1 cysteine methyltransferase [Maribacter sp.]HAI43763.1 cysteine methyltransferase [Maribacter sp.]|tara:strand:+ start:164782 stop:165258 length:477 start_codon:yes stop_codon:yes gene_type:complete